MRSVRREIESLVPTLPSTKIIFVGYAPKTNIPEQELFVNPTVPHGSQKMTWVAIRMMIRSGTGAFLSGIYEIARRNDTI